MSELTKFNNKGKEGLSFIDDDECIGENDDCPYCTYRRMAIDDEKYFCCNEDAGKCPLVIEEAI